MRNVPCRDVVTRRFAVSFLIIKEYVSIECAKELTLI